MTADAKPRTLNQCVESGDELWIGATDLEQDATGISFVFEGKMQRVIVKMTDVFSLAQVEGGERRWTILRRADGAVVLTHTSDIPAVTEAEQPPAEDILESADTAATHALVDIAANRTIRGGSVHAHQYHIGQFE